MVTGSNPVPGSICRGSSVAEHLKQPAELVHHTFPGRALTATAYTMELSQEGRVRFPSGPELVRHEGQPSQCAERRRRRNLHVLSLCLEHYLLPLKGGDHDETLPSRPLPTACSGGHARSVYSHPAVSAQPDPRPRDPARDWKGDTWPHAGGCAPGAAPNTPGAIQSAESAAAANTQPERRCRCDRA
jgi:hypothetical protein